MSMRILTQRLAGPALLGTLMLLPGALTSCKKPAVQPVEQPKLVKTMVVPAAAAAATHEYPGNVRAFDEAELSFVVPGRIVALPIKEGQQLAHGALIGRLDDREFKSAVDAALSQYKLQQTRMASSRQLYDKGVISKDEFDLQTRNTDVAKAELETATKNLEDTVLKAPFAGRLARRYVEQGQNVQAKQAVALQQDISRLKLTINVPEQNVARGTSASLEEAVKRVRCTASFPSLPGRTFELALHEFSTAADPATRTYAITFAMAVPTNALILPGMTATVTAPTRIEAVAGATAVNVPLTAVWANPAGTSCVWVVNTQTMRVQQRVVTLGEMKDSTVDIRSGLVPGDTIVVAGVNQLANEQLIRNYDE
jgi:RND family efflux transporter MFP subunit